jgi:hypothetical protein
LACAQHCRELVTAKLTKNPLKLGSTHKNSPIFTHSIGRRGFKLYAHIADLTKAGAIRTDLRIAILEAFNEAGIVFPFPQTEVTIRDMDWLRAAIADYVSRGYNGKGAENGNPASRLVPGPMQSSERIV